jgi:pantetheine-phosphate adenylyltransferase
MGCAIYPGSFDPVTLGHIDIIKRASGMFDELIIGILVNKNKKSLFEVSERKELLESILKGIPNVRVETHDGLLADFVKKTGARAIVRGLRNSTDFEYEYPMAVINKKLYEKADTVFLMTSPEYSYISSSGLKELMAFGADISAYVPKEVMNYLHKN